MSSAEIKAQYQQLAAQVGDLYFVLENAGANLKALQDKMDALKAKRHELQAAYEAALAAEAQPAEAGDVVAATTAD